MLIIIQFPIEILLFSRIDNYNYLNSLRPSDGSILLAQVTACCLTAPSHQWYFFISDVLWHSPDSNFTVSAQSDIPYINELKNSQNSALQQKGPTPNFPRPLRNPTPKNLLRPSKTWQICSRCSAIHLSMREQAHGRAAGISEYQTYLYFFMCRMNFSIWLHFNIYAGHLCQIIWLDFKAGMHLKKC